MLETKQETQSHTNSIGKLLIERGKLNAADLDRARRVQQETPERINVILTQLGLVSERDMAEALALYLDLPLVTAADYPTQAILEDQASTKFLKKYRIIPLADTAEGLVLAIADPLDAYAVNAMRLLTGKPVLPRVGVPAEIEAAFESLYGSSKASIENILE